MGIRGGGGAGGVYEDAAAMKLRVFEKADSLHKVVSMEIPFEIIERHMMTEVIERFVDRVAHVMAREYLKRRRPSLEKVINQEWIERRVRRAIREAAKL
jgi:hypothetical protein